MATVEERLETLETTLSGLDDRLTELEENINAPNDDLYNSAHSGQQIDEAIASVRSNELTWTGKANKGTTVSLVLSKNGWDENQKTQELRNDIFVASDSYRYLVGSAVENETAYGEAGVKANNVTTAGQITFRCEVFPKEDLAVEIVRMEVEA